MITGHEMPNKEISFIDWESFRENETLIFLMGLHNLRKITHNLITNSALNPSHPIAVISKGTTKEQKVAIGTLQNIEEKAKDLQTPALIIVGEVVNLKDKLQWF